MEAWLARRPAAQQVVHEGASVGHAVAPAILGAPVLDAFGALGKVARIAAARCAIVLGAVIVAITDRLCAGVCIVETGNAVPCRLPISPLALCHRRTWRRPARAPPPRTSSCTRQRQVPSPRAAAASLRDRQGACERVVTDLDTLTSLPASATLPRSASCATIALRSFGGKQGWTECGAGRTIAQTQ